MRNVANLLLKSWFELLDNKISVPVYRTDAPPDATNYVLLRAESETDRSNNQNSVTAPIIITEVVCLFSVRIDDTVAQGIDDEVAQLLFPAGPVHNLPAQDGIQITNVKRFNATYLPEDDGTFRIHRIITRHLHRVVHLITA